MNSILARPSNDQQLLRPTGKQEHMATVMECFGEKMLCVMNEITLLLLCTKKGRFEREAARRVLESF